MAKVTVVVPTFEQAAFLPRALGSLRDQEERDWEAFVVDDGSTDDTPAVAASWIRDGRIRYVRWDRNRGLGAALNAGLRRGRAPVVGYLPSDDVWQADHLAGLLAAFDDGEVTMAWSGVRHRGRSWAEAPDGFGLQLVQVCHRRTALRWPEREELESDDLERLFWHALRTGRTLATGRATCEWTDHPRQRHKAIRESFDGGLNVFRSRYRVGEPLRFHSTDSGTVDEVALYDRFRRHAYRPSPDGLKILLAGELGFNAERVLALAERGHRLYGLWTSQGLADNAVGPLPFGHVEDLPPDRWREAVCRIRPDVVYAQLNWRAVRLAHAVMDEMASVPFLWHFKESPQRSIIRGEWPLLADLVTRSDRCLLATEEERRWFELALPELHGTGRLGVLDGDLPKADWLCGERSPKLSDRDGEPHTVVLGRPVGIDPQLVLWLAAHRVHLHLYGLVNTAARGWQTWLPEVRARAPHHVHVHEAVPASGWVRELSRYDAGWLHQFPSSNGGDLRVATWDDLNTPARLPVLLAAGLPLILRANPGHAVAVNRIAHETGAGLVYRQLEELPARLGSELASRAAGDAAWSIRHRYTFDHHADRLLGELRRAGERSHV